MTITVDIRPDVQAKLARQAAAHGSTTEVHAASLLEEAVNLAAGTTRPSFDKERAQAAGARIRELRKGVTLGGLTIRELIDEGRATQRWHQHVGGSEEERVLGDLDMREPGLAFPS